MEVLKLVEDLLKIVKEEFKISYFYRVVRSLYLFVEGEIYYRRKNVFKVFKSLFGFLKIMEEFWKNYISKIRCLNVIGNCYNR